MFFLNNRLFIKFYESDFVNYCEFDSLPEVKRFIPATHFTETSVQMIEFDSFMRFSYEVDYQNMRKLVWFLSD